MPLACALLLEVALLLECAEAFAAELSPELTLDSGAADLPLPLDVPLPLVWLLLPCEWLPLPVPPSPLPFPLPFLPSPSPPMVCSLCADWLSWR